MIGWSELIKKFVGLDVIWGARSKKVAGIQDRYNTITEVISFDGGTNQITFSTAVPAWMKSAGSNGKAIRVMNAEPHPNANKKYYVASIISPTVVQVTPANPAADGMITFSGLTEISGRIWEVVQDENLCGSDREGNTVYNLHHKERGANDGGDVSLVHIDHYHGRIVTHEYNSAGWPNLRGQYVAAPDGMGGFSMQLIPAVSNEPEVVVSNDGQVVKA